MDSARVLFANEAFYVAFSNSDLEAMDALWARRAPVCCIHPGWPALTDRDAVMKSWERILANLESPEVRTHHARTLDHGRVMAVICYERLEDTMLATTNLFVQEDGEAKLVHHQSSQCANPPPPEDRGPPEVQ